MRALGQMSNWIIAIACIGMIFIIVTMDYRNDNVARGWRFVKRGDYKRAISISNHIIGEHGKDLDVSYLRGFAYLQIGEFDLAIDDFTFVINGNPKQVDAYYNRGSAWYKKNEFAKAIADYDKVIELNQKDFKAYGSRAETWMALKEYDNAIADYTVAISNNQYVVFNLLGRATANYKKHDYDRAINDNLLAVAKAPESPFAYNNLAWIYSTCPDDRVRNGSKAVEYAERAIALSNSRADGYVEFLHTYAAALAENNQFDKAIDVMTEITHRDNGVINFEADLELFRKHEALRISP